MLLAAGIYDPKEDKPDQGWVMPGAKSEPGKIVVVTEGMSNTVTVPGLADALLSVMDGVKTAHYDESKLVELIETIRTAETVVHCGDSPLAYLSAALGIRTIVVKNNRWTKDFWDQYAHFSNVELALGLDAESVDDCARHIANQITAAPKPRQVPKVMRGSAELIDDDKSIMEQSAEIKESRRAPAFAEATDDVAEAVKSVGKVIDDDRSSHTRARRGSRGK